MTVRQPLDDRVFNKPALLHSVHLRPHFCIDFHHNLFSCLQGAKKSKYLGKILLIQGVTLIKQPFCVDQVKYQKVTLCKGCVWVVLLNADNYLPKQSCTPTTILRFLRLCVRNVFLSIVTLTFTQGQKDIGLPRFLLETQLECVSDI